MGVVAIATVDPHTAKRPYYSHPVVMDTSRISDGKRRVFAAAFTGCRRGRWRPQALFTALSGGQNPR